MNPVLYFKNIVSKEDKIIVPIYAKGFTDIGAFNITITYNKDVMLLTDPPGGLHCKKGTLGCNNNTPGQIKFGWFTWPGVSIPDESILLELGFTKVNDGVSMLYFVTDFGLSNDSWEPLETTYINATVTLKEETNRTVTLNENIMERITLIYKNVAAILKAGQIIEVPISLTDEMDVTAISLTCKYPNDLIEVVDITSDIVSENFLFSQLPPDQVRVSWFHQTPIKTFEIKIKCKVLADVPLGQELKFVAYEADQINKLNELAGWDYNPIEGVELHTVSLTQKATVAAKKAAQGYTGKPFYPKCSNCANHDGVKRCIPGGFVVAKGGLCKLHPDLAK